MKCPICIVDLLVADRQGIEVDYCPTCRGVWLDRGELDKLIERTGPAPTPPPSRGPYRDDSDVLPPSGYHPKNRGYHSSPPQYPPKRKSFLGELFDFG